MLPIAQFYSLANVTLKFWAFGLFYTIVRFRHIGIDIGTGRKAVDVPALLGGTVVKVVRTSTMGMVVVLRVGDRFHAYCHLANVDLPDEGDVIKQGQRVGKLAWTKDPKSEGFAGTAWNGIHLHFVVSNRADGAYRYPKAKDAEFFNPALVIAVVLATPQAPVIPVIPKPSKPAPSGTVKPASTRRNVRANVRELNGRAGASATAAIAGKPLKAKATGNFTGFMRGQKVTIQGVTSNVWFRGTSGRYFAAAGFTSQSVAGLKDLGTWKAPVKPKPVPKPKPIKPKPKTLHLPTYYWYDHPVDAEKHQDPHGKRRGESMLSGAYTVLETSKGGAFKVRSAANGVVWVSPVAKKYLR